MISRNRLMEANVLVSAIAFVTARYVDIPDDMRRAYIDLCKTRSIRTMHHVSLETLQTFLLVAVDTINRGKPPKEWGSVIYARQLVQSLGLVQEDADTQNPFLKPSVKWVEVEERRRYFWMAFILDKYGYIWAGWDIVFPQNLIRRLPCDGQFWKQCRPVNSPFFFDSSKRIGAGDDMNASGGFAYFIEVTDMLSEIVKLHRQTAENTDLEHYMGRIQQFDIMLTIWHSSLKDHFRYPTATSEGYMDENISIASLIYYVCVIVLHLELAFDGRIIKAESVQATANHKCHIAAQEIAKQARNFLVRMPNIVPPQFTFSAFVAAGALLAEANYREQPVDSTFSTLLSLLEDISNRWRGNDDLQLENLAGILRTRLQQAQAITYKIDSEWLSLLGLVSSEKYFEKRVDESTTPLPQTSNSEMSSFSPEGEIISMSKF